jgi:hypothetical protein
VIAVERFGRRTREKLVLEKLVDDSLVDASSGRDFAVFIKLNAEKLGTQIVNETVSWTYIERE